MKIIDESKKDSGLTFEDVPPLVPFRITSDGVIGIKLCNDTRLIMEGPYKGDTPKLLPSTPVFKIYPNSFLTIRE